MKIVLAFAIAVILLTVMAPVALADSGITVYVSVSVDGELLVAAQPVTTTDMTVNGAVKAAHAAYYSGGESGYTAGIDPTWNMYLITKCWGITGTPFVIINDAPLGATGPQTVDTTPVAANDNIIICTSSDPTNKPATPVSLKATLSGDKATVTATSWILDFATFTYSHGPLANAKVIDPTTSASLGTTDANGQITVTVPASGIVAIDGLAAINVKNLPASAPATTTATTSTSSSGSGVTVYVSVSIDAKLLVDAQPVTVTGNLTVDAAIKAAHAAYYSGGESGYTAGIDAVWNMFLISKCWGIQTTPYVIVNEAPFNAPPNGLLTAETAPVAANDNIIICTGTDMVNNPAQPVSLKSTLSGDSATVTATLWTLDFTTFQYSSAPLANADVLNSSSTSLGKTDADGKITVTIPADGIVIIKGLAAINVKAVSTPATTTATTSTTPAGKEIPLLYGNTISLIIVGVVILTPIAVIVIVKMVRQSRLDKPAAASKNKQ